MWDVWSYGGRVRVKLLHIRLRDYHIFKKQGDALWAVHVSVKKSDAE